MFDVRMFSNFCPKSVFPSSNVRRTWTNIRTFKNIQCSVAPDHNIHQTQTEHIQDVNLPRIRTLDKLLSGKAELILIIPKKAKGSPS